jgi:hypothetical protein
MVDSKTEFNWGQRVKEKVIAYLLVLFLIFPVGLAQAQFGGDGCRTVRYSGVTPNMFECMRQDLQNSGIYITPGKSGELSGNGFSADFEYDGKSNLTITITDKPFFVTCRTITDRIRQFAQDCADQ